MSKFYKHRLRMEKHYTYIVVPEEELGLQIYLENHHVPYEIDYPWELPESVNFDERWPGRKINEDMVVYKTKCNAKDLMEIAQETSKLSPTDIGDEYNPGWAEIPSEEEHYRDLAIGGWSPERIEEERQERQRLRQKEIDEMKSNGLSDEQIRQYYEDKEKARLAFNAAADVGRHYEEYMTHFED